MFSSNFLPNCLNPGVGAVYPVLPPSSNDGTDWIYTHRRTAQEIIPGLYLGPYASATNSALGDMIDKGITHVVCVRQVAERRYIRTNHEEHFKYMVVELDDSPLELVIGRIKEVNAFLDECFASGGTALIHGNCGLSRSPVFAIGYVMWKYGVTAEVARPFVQSKRFCISPPEYFLTQLFQFEPIVRAMHSTPLQLPQESEFVRPTLKRGREDDDQDLGEEEPIKVLKADDEEIILGVQETDGAGDAADEPMEAQS